MKLKSLQQQQQQQQQAGGSTTKTSNGGGGRVILGPQPQLQLPSPSLHKFSSLSDAEKISDIIFIEEPSPSKINILKNKNFISAVDKVNTNSHLIKNANASKLVTSPLLLPAPNETETDQAKKNSTNKQKQNENTPFNVEISTSIEKSQSLEVSVERNRNLYFKNKFQPKFENRNSSISPSVSTIGAYNLNRNSADLMYSSNNSLHNNSSMLLTKYQEQPMAQYTKFTKTIFNENNYQHNHNGHNSIANNNTNNHVHLKPTATTMNEKSPSRTTNMSNMMHSTIVQNSPLSMINNSATSSSKKGPSLLGRSVTMKYMSRPYVDASGSFVNQQQVQQQQLRPQQTQHFNYNNYNNTTNNTSLHRRASFYHQNPVVSLENPKKELISPFSSTNLNRSSSIKLNREKTSLTNYFSSLSNQQSNHHHNLTLNFLSASNNSDTNNKLNKKNQPVSLRNNTLNRNSSNVNSSTTNFNAKSLLYDQHHNGSKNSISLENVMNGFDMLLTSSNDAQLSSKFNYNINNNNNANGSLIVDHSGGLNQASLKLVSSSNSNGNLLNRTRRSDELMLVESPNINDESVEIKQLKSKNGQTKLLITNNNKSIDFTETKPNNSALMLKSPYENDSEIIENNSNAIDKKLTNKLREDRNNFNQMNKGESFLKKTKSFIVIDSKQMLNSNDTTSKLINGANKQDSSPNSLNELSNPKSKSTNTQIHPNSNSHNSQVNSYYVKASTNNVQHQPQNSRITRSNSKLSHVTRDVNDSYAYTNVQQYIEENDLMPPDKAFSIRKWIRVVNQSKDDWEKRTIEINIVDG